MAEEDVRLSPRPGSKEHEHAGVGCWCWEKTVRGKWRVRPSRPGEGYQRVSITTPGLTGVERKKRMRHLAKEVAKEKAEKAAKEAGLDTHEMGLTDKKGRIIWSEDVKLTILAWVSDGLNFKKIIEKLNTRALDFWKALEGDEEFKTEFNQAFGYSLRSKIDEVCDILSDAGVSDSAIRRAAEIAKHLRWLGERLMPETYGEKKYREDKQVLEIGKELGEAIRLEQLIRAQLQAKSPGHPSPAQVIDVTPEDTKQLPAVTERSFDE